ncbi:MAG: alpha/beta hydrolase family protein, partial [Ginsengibacter sp.]
MKIILFAVCFFLSLTNLKGQDSAVSDLNASAAIWTQISPYFSPPDVYKGEYGTYRSPLKFYDGHLVKSPEDWTKRRKEILTRWNKLMGEWPPLLKDQEMKMLDSIHREGFTQYRVEFYWTPHEKTQGYLLIPDNKGKNPAVITVYYEPETAIGLGKPDHPNRDFAYQLAKRGFVTLSIGTTKATEDSVYS